MKLYSVKLSPYAARVRMAIYAKDLPIEIVYPPEGGTQSPEYLAINPLGKVPCLMLDNGTSLPESEVILEYLEDAFPERPLRPDSPEDRASARLIARIVDLHMGPPGSKLFRQLDPAIRNPREVETLLGEVAQALGWLEPLFGPGRYAVGERLSTADCSIAPLLYFLPTFVEGFGRPDLVESHPRLRRYLAGMRDDPVIARVFAELDEAAVVLRTTGAVS